MIEDHIDLIKKISFSLRTKCSKWNDDEIFSSALVNGWKRLEKFDPEKTTIEKYLSFTISKDVVYDYMRDMGYRKQSDSSWKLREDFRTNCDTILESRVCTTNSSEPDVSELSDLQKEIVDLRLNGLTQEQIGIVLDKSKAWVCIELKKIKTILKEN